MEKMQMGNVELNKPIRETTYETLKQAIIMGEIPAGSRLIETVYAESLHISRTPLREAFRMLELDGLVEYEERRGVIVRAFTIEDIEETFTIRNALMMLIVPSVIRNVTPDDISELEDILRRMDVSHEAEDVAGLAVLNRQFHRKIEHISDKKRILRVLESQQEYLTRFSQLTITSMDRRSDAHREHHLLLRLLEKRDEENFSELMRKHLYESKIYCLQTVSLHRDGKAAGT